MGGNPKGSKWSGNVPQAMRRKPKVSFTLDPEEIRMLDTMAGPGGKARVVGEAIRAKWRAEGWADREKTGKAG